MISAMVFLPVKDGMAKILGSAYPPLQIIWAQFCIVYLMVAPVIAFRRGAGMLWPRPLGLQALRGVFTVWGIGFFYWGVRFIPLASTTSIYFLALLVVTVLSPLVLKERVDMRRWTAVVVGFLGVTLILRPDLHQFNKGFFIAFVGGISIGLFYICSRKLATGPPAVVMLAHSVLIGAVLASFVVPFMWANCLTSNVTHGGVKKGTLTHNSMVPNIGRQNFLGSILPRFWTCPYNFNDFVHGNIGSSNAWNRDPQPRLSSGYKIVQLIYV
jgi:drug/metabolite transporter (DMT)-like permease